MNVQKDKIRFVISDRLKRTLTAIALRHHLKIAKGHEPAYHPTPCKRFIVHYHHLQAQESTPFAVSCSLCF